MRHHYIYFAILPVLLLVALMLPFTIYEYDINTREVRNGYDDDVTPFVFGIPMVISTVLLIIRNYVTAILGACFYLVSFGLASFMSYMIYYDRFYDATGIGPLCVWLVTLTGLVLGIVQSVKMTKNKELKRKQSTDLLDFD